MQLFFEEESSKRLISTQQIIMTLIIGYVEFMHPYLAENPKILTSVKNIL
jgi:hypothetical protein